MRIRGLPRRRERSPGQSLVEFALILPVFLVILSVALDLGRLAYARVTIANVAREASFQAAQTPTAYQAGQPCDSANPDQNRVICRAILESTGSVITVAPADIALKCSPDCDREMGNTVSVTATGRFSLLTPVMAVFFGGSTIAFSSTATNQISAMPELAAADDPPPPPPTDTTVVPNLVGVAEAEVPALLAAADLTAGSRTEDFDATVPVGSVISQSPAAGTIVAKGSAVSYVISKGPAPVDCSTVSAGFTFTSSPSSGSSPVTVTVTDTTTWNAACSTVWAWDWGDGSATFGQAQAPHVYRNQTGPSGNVKKFYLTLTVTSGTFTDTSGTVEIAVTK